MNRAHIVFSCFVGTFHGFYTVQTVYTNPIKNNFLHFLKTPCSMIYEHFSSWEPKKCPYKYKGFGYCQLLGGHFVLIMCLPPRPHTHTQERFFFGITTQTPQNINIHTNKFTYNMYNTKQMDQRRPTGHKTPQAHKNDAQQTKWQNIINKSAQHIQKHSKETCKHQKTSAFSTTLVFSFRRCCKGVQCVLLGP